MPERRPVLVPAALLARVEAALPRRRYRVVVTPEPGAVEVAPPGAPPTGNGPVAYWTDAEDDGALRRAVEAAAPPRVLVVDDHPTNRALYEGWFRHLGYEVHLAVGGAEALELAARVRPDVILTDVMMPGMDGWHLAAAVRTHPELGDTPIVAVSAHLDDPDDADLSRACGADAFVPRSSVQGVLAAVRRLLDDGPTVREAVDPDRTAPPRLDRLRRAREAHGWTEDDVPPAGGLAPDPSEALARAAGVVALRPTVAAVLAGLLHAAATDRTTSLAVLYLRDELGALVPRGSAGRANLDPELVPDPAAVAEALGGAAASAATRRLWAPGVPPEGAAVAVAARFPARSAALFPLVLVREPLGVLLAGSDRLDLGEPPWSAVLQALAAQLALGIGIARLEPEVSEPPAAPSIEDARVRRAREERLREELVLVARLAAGPGRSGGRPERLAQHLAGGRVERVDLAAAVRDAARQAGRPALGVSAPCEPVWVVGVRAALVDALAEVLRALPDGGSVRLTGHEEARVRASPPADPAAAAPIALAVLRAHHGTWSPVGGGWELVLPLAGP